MKIVWIMEIVVMIFKICAKNLREAKSLVQENVMINARNTKIVVQISKIFAP